ncbi:lipopolysaccharide biosynthesis protein [Mycolicibacterium sarraceniae]|uniref:Polysaccharide biosynthesis protein n=1 Tax=Mycolicibacterium sarraceniae TaxID=1534348 RepID=A0A7I7SRM0_9MYCO|nr:hypothetical protein [Mycolicibacterium sarraceniae]BBY59667.1 hypothetical protein MSAR_28030 [Mycolicibacterium sarraceniae]
MSERIELEPSASSVGEPVESPVRRGGEVDSADGGLFLRNAYALVLNTGITGALGLVYWFLAAHHYRDADVGRGSAAISALMALTSLVSLNAAGTLNRFIPKAGKHSFAVVACAYVLTSAAVAALAFCFLATLSWWGGPVFDLLRTPSMQLWFVGGAVVASVITVQESVLTGLRAAVWVPLWNAIFGVAKIILLLLLAGSMPRSGVFFSWIVPMVVIMFPASLQIFVWLLPRHIRRTAPDIALQRGQIGRFFAADYLGALFMFATMFLVPVLVAARVEAHTYAYFFLAWSVAGILNMVACNLSTSMAVESVYDMGSLARHCRAALTRAVGLLLVGVVGVSLAAPYALGLFGPGYLDAAPVLQLLAFASLPAGIIEIYLGTLRARTQRRQIIWVQSARGMLVLALVVVLMRCSQLFAGFGDPRITAVGVAVLVGQGVVMLAVLPGLGRVLGYRRHSLHGCASR